MIATGGDSPVQRVLVVLDDDLDGTPADETVRFGLDGVHYEIDLSDANAKELRQALTPFTTRGRRPTRPAAVSGPWSLPRPEPATLTQTQRIRIWARENGYQVRRQGSIPSWIIRAYKDEVLR